MGAGLPAVSVQRRAGADRQLYLLEECLRSASVSILAHGMRSFLTMLGVIIGVASVICVVALTQGLSQYITGKFAGLGSGTLTLQAYTPTEDALRGKINHLRTGDLDALRYEARGIAHVTPLLLVTTAPVVRYGANSSTGQLYGTTSSLLDVQGLEPHRGRFLTGSDDNTGRRVAVLGDQMRKDLKLPEDPTGIFVQVGTEWFKIVGVLEPRGELFGQSLDNFLVMPYETARALNGLTAEPNLSISFTVKDLDDVDNIRIRTTGLIRRLHGIKGGAADDFKLASADSLASAFQSISTTVTLVVAGLVGISLLVGGIGIMNIMLVSVTERTREIGISKALGAPRSFILLQFLIEAMALALIGGLIGIACGFALAYGISGLISVLPSPSVPWWVVVGACLFSLLVGTLFGILPASRAANLSPIDALRYE